VTARLDVRLEVAQNRVVLEQMGEGACVGQVVDRDEVQLARAERRAHDVAADAAESVDTDFDGHLILRHVYARAVPRRARRHTPTVNVAQTEGESQGPSARCSARSVFAPPESLDSSERLARGSIRS